MKVSLRRKIHIMALPQETFLNARWSEDQSAAMPCQPEGRVGTAPVSTSAASAIFSCPFLLPLSLGPFSWPSSGQQLATEGGEVAHPRRQEREQDEPEGE